MKNYLAGLLLILVTFSCTSKKEGETQVLGRVDTSNPVGVISNGNFHIIEIEENSPKWEAVLKESIPLGNNASLSKFEIIKTVTRGDSAEDCYLLLTHTADGFSAIAVLLRLEDGKLYFDVSTNGKRRAGQAIMCKGTSAASGCVPAVIIQNKQKRLVCSDNGCEKLGSEISF